MYLHSLPIPSQRLKISDNDTTPDFLSSKLAAGTGVSLTVNNDGANETLTVANTDTGSAAVSLHLSAFSHAPLSQKASAAVDGYLSSGDWSTFNGKFSLPALTAGSVLFSDGSTIAQKNVSLFWDNTNNRLGLGLTNPTRRIDLLDTANPQLRLTHTAGSVYGEVQATSSGYLEFNATGNRILLGKDDSDKTFWGAGYDMSAYYNGTDGYLKTDEVAASDLHITTGAAKTLVYDTAVYDDLNFDPSSSGGAAVTLPDYVTINSCIYREFTSANNQLCGDGEELPHSYKLSSTLYPHVHCFLKSGESAGTTGVTFTLYWSLRQAAGVTSGSVALSATSTELTNNANKFNLNDATGFAGASELGGQLSLTLARTGGNAGDVIVTSYGVHYAIDTPGSRTASTK